MQYRYIDKLNKLLFLFWTYLCGQPEKSVTRVVSNEFAMLTV